MNPLAIALVISLAINAALGWAYLGQRDKAVVAVDRTEQATGVAVACSTGVDNLQTQAETRRLAAASQILAAKKTATAASKKADTILATPASTPGNDCKSAADRIDTWWADRGGK